MNEFYLPHDANVIASHVIYKRKEDGSAKARIVPWEHRDRDKGYLRGDAPSVSFEVFILILSIAAEKSGILVNWM